MVAGGKEQVGISLLVSVNFTGITPRLALKMPLPSALTGGCTNALYGKGLTLMSTPTFALKQH